MGLMSCVVPVIISRGVVPLILAVDILFSMKHTHNNTRSQQYAGDLDLSIIQLVICLMVLYFPSVWFRCCWCYSLFQFPIKYILSKSRTLPLVSTFLAYIVCLTRSSATIIVIGSLNISQVYYSTITLYEHPL